MKLTYVQLDGTPEELDASELGKKLLASVTSASVQVGATEGESGGAARGWTSIDPVPGVAAEGQSEVKKLLSRNEAAEHFIAFLQETSSWENVGVHGVKRKTAQPGDPLDYSDYLRLRRQGSQLGGFAYVYALNGVVNLRLNYDGDLDGLTKLAPDAYPLHTGHRAYRVNIQVTDERTLQQALSLAKLAYDLT